MAEPDSCKGVNHFHLVSDPGCHNYQEVLVSVLYNWETDQAFHCPWQFLVPGKQLTPEDCDMDEEMWGYNHKHKLTRVAAFRQLQGYNW